MAMDPVALLADLIALPGPPGQEEAVRDYVRDLVERMGYWPTVDAKGNLIVDLGDDPQILVTAHLDEIAMLVTAVGEDGQLEVRNLGGLHPWKLGEGPVRILGLDSEVNGVMGFGSAHTEDPSARSVLAKANGPTWSFARVFTGLSPDALDAAGVVPGVRVVVADRELRNVNGFFAGRFLDDRADLVSWLLALAALRGKRLPVRFAATVSEEVGGEGARWIMGAMRPTVCVALELGPNVPDAPVLLNDVPTMWVTDSYATASPDDMRLVRSLEPDIQFQSLSRGGSDASCGASEGLCARPITLGLPMENTHGFEIIHPDSMARLGDLTVRLVTALADSV